MRYALVFLIALITPAAKGQTTAYEQILVPFDTMTLETASGRWRSELWVRNNGATPINIWAAECVQFGSPVACSRRLDVPAGRTILADGFDPDGSSPGVLLYVDRNRINDLVFSLRVRDLNRGAEDFGTDIPVVREAMLHRGIAHLINIPLQPNGRLHLRIYSVMSTAAYLVSVYAEPTGQLLAQRTFAAAQPADGMEPPELPMMIDASPVLRGWVVDRVRVTIESINPPGAIFWPLLTITHARTNHVTVIPAR